MKMWTPLVLALLALSVNALSDLRLTLVAQGENRAIRAGDGAPLQFRVDYTADATSPITRANLKFSDLGGLTITGTGCTNNVCSIPALASTQTLSVTANAGAALSVGEVEITATIVAVNTANAEVPCSATTETECVENVKKPKIIIEAPVLGVVNPVTNPSLVLRGSEVQLSAQISNTAVRAPATSVKVTLTFPSEFSPIAVTGCVVAPNNALVCDVPDIAAGATSPVFTARANTTTTAALQTYQIGVSIASTPPATTSPVNFGVQLVGPDLTIIVSDPPAVLKQGETFDLGYQVTATGQAASSVVVAITWDSTKFESVNATGCTSTTPGTTSCTIGALASGSSSKVTPKFRVKSFTEAASFGGENIEIVGTVSSNPVDSDTTNNAVTFSGKVSFRDADLEIQQTSTLVTPIGNHTVTLRVTNKGPESAPHPNTNFGFRVIATFPTGFTFVSTSSTEWACAGTSPVTCTPNTALPSAGTRDLPLLVTVPNSAAGLDLASTYRVEFSNTPTTFARDPTSTNNEIKPVNAVATSDSCTGRCSAAKPRSGCACDEDCTKRRDCCKDANTACAPNRADPALSFNPALKNINTLVGKQQKIEVRMGAITPVKTDTAPADAYSFSSAPALTPTAVGVAGADFSPAVNAAGSFTYNITSKHKVFDNSITAQVKYHVIAPIADATTLASAAQLATSNDFVPIANPIVAPNIRVFWKNTTCSGGCTNSGSFNLQARNEDLVICHGRISASLAYVVSTSCVFSPADDAATVNLPEYTFTSGDFPAIIVSARTTGTLAPAAAPVTTTAKRDVEATGTVKFVTNFRNSPVVNTALTITPPAATAGAAYTFAIPSQSFTDVDVTNGAEVLVWSLVESPTWSRFNPATREITGTPAIIDVGEITVIVKVTDSTGLSAVRSFKLTVNPPENLISSAAATLAAGKQYTSDYLFLNGYFDIIKICVTPTAGYVSDFFVTGDFEGGVLGNEIKGAFCTYCRQIKHGESFRRRRDLENASNTEGGFRLIVVAGTEGATFTTSAQSVVPSEKIVNFNLKFKNLGKFVDA